ncbi:hypothetical protein [Microbulbifer celer]|uniref:Integral membrane protein n=1 Tax=Microbulbifer celer TaxID=435905 RepID=A0ABW3UAD1_9GAMM|nr:hypothetical protein [Microbulbifer celer]UFN56989.1 hypothetical protein LPW13_15695 [Microbulbifer celer]
MELIQRYVDNVKNYLHSLPAAKREDIGNELLADLQDARDELEQTLGHAPNESEVAALLKRRGHPMQVAAGYHPRRTLVSDALFPLYVQVLKWVLLVIAVVNGAVAVLGLVNHPDPQFIAAAIGWLTGTFNGGIHGFAWVTLGFYLAGEGMSFGDVFGKWDPRRLPGITDSGQRIGAFDSLVELVVTLLALAWLNDAFPAVTQSDAGNGFSLVLSTYLQAMLPWLNLALAASVLMALDKLFFPYWTRSKLIVDGLINAIWLLLCAWLFTLPASLGIHWGDAGVYWEMSTGHWRGVIAIIFLITAWDLIRNLQRLWTSRTRRLVNA